MNSRIPQLSAPNPEGAKQWLKKMHQRGLLFCLDDTPHDVICIDTGLPAFSPEECGIVSNKLAILFGSLGDKVPDLAFDIVSQSFHTAKERSALAMKNG